MATGLPTPRDRRLHDPAGVLTSVRLAGSLVFITSVREGQEHISILRMNRRPCRTVHPGGET